MNTAPISHIVIYHGHCTDGFGAAYYAWCSLGHTGVAYHEGHYNKVNTPEDFVREYGDPAGKRIHILDFSFPRQVMDWLIGDESRSAGIVWLDHHKTAFEMWLGPEHDYKQFKHRTLGRHHIILDNDKSGALLAKDYYLGEVAIRPLAHYIDDRDRWQWKMDGTKDIHAALQALQPWSFEQWAAIEKHGIPVLMARGGTVREEWERQIRDMTKRPNYCMLSSRTDPVSGEHTPTFDIRGLDIYWTCPGLAVNSPLHHSEIGNLLAEKSGTYGLVWSIAPGELLVRCSIRSIGDYDVSAIAKFYGGGGHRNAAGFSVPLSAIADILRPAPPKT